MHFSSGEEPAITVSEDLFILTAVGLETVTRNCEHNKQQYHAFSLPFNCNACVLLTVIPLLM